MKYNWTTREVAIVREHYPQGGLDACAKLLQRTRYAIYQRARTLGLSAPGQTGGAREKWPNDPEIDARIKRLHETPLMKGAITEFAERINRPCWYVSRRARELGLKTPRFRELPWTPAEIDLLHETAHIGTKNAQKRFKRAGYVRSETAIHVKRKREGISTTLAKQDHGLYTAGQVASLFGVDAKTVTRWIHLAELRAKRRGTERVEIQGGDMWTVTERDLREI